MESYTTTYCRRRPFFDFMIQGQLEHQELSPYSREFGSLNGETFRRTWWAYTPAELTWRKRQKTESETTVRLLQRQVCSPLVSKKKEIPNGDRNRLEQDQPTHVTPFGLGLGILHSPKQRRLRQKKACDHVPRLFPAMVALKHNLLDRFISISLHQRFYCLLRKTVLKGFFGHNGKGVYQKRPAHVFLISMAQLRQAWPRKR